MLNLIKMKNIKLTILYLFLALFTTSCVKNDIVLPDSSTVPTVLESAMNLMLPWQIEEIKKLNISDQLAKYYISQKGLLYWNVEQDDSLRILFDSAPQDEYNMNLITLFHEQIGHWFLMRDNIVVLHTEPYADKLYSIILAVGDDGAGGLFLVEYNLSSENDISISNIVHGISPISSGFYPNIAYFDYPIIFGFTKLMRYDPQSDTKIKSNFAFIEVEEINGKIIKKEIKNEASIILIFLENWEEITDCRLLDIEQNILENFTL